MTAWKGCSDNISSLGLIMMMHGDDDDDNNSNNDDDDDDDVDDVSSFHRGLNALVL